MSIRRSTIRRLQEALRGNLASFELLDGTRYYYDPQELHKQLFLFAFDAQLRWTQWIGVLVTVAVVSLLPAPRRTPLVTVPAADARLAPASA